jgi:hypothetical protein
MICRLLFSATLPGNQAFHLFLGWYFSIVVTAAFWRRFTVSIEAVRSGYLFS